MIGYLTHNQALVHAFQPRAPVAAGRARRESAVSRRVFSMAPKLSDLIFESEIAACRGSLDRPISGLVTDSRRVVPGQVFFALAGLRSDGAHYVDEAVNRGAVAVVTSRIPTTTPSRVTFIQVADPRVALARMAQRYYKFPDRDLEIVGVTGTSGKTTVSHLIKHLMEKERRGGLLGTIHYDLGARTVPSFKTTPESLDIFGMLAQMRDSGCREAVMEVSSHGIDQKRVLGLQFGAVVFTNLTHDHLDYHRDMEQYFEVKSRLFAGGTGALPKVAVINVDDPRGPALVAKVPAGVRAVTFGEHPAAEVRAESVTLNLHHARFRLVWPEGTLIVESPLVGRYNVSNLLAAIATLWALGRDPRVFLGKVSTFKSVAGRMERVDDGQPFHVLVDYAHTDDALRNALGMLRSITPGRLLVVFGCGGDRDRTKRAQMVREVQAHADFGFATADNPRGESLEQIFEDMKPGVTAPEKIAWIDDRRRAISLALDMAKPGDCVLIAGKGHESYQEFSDTVIPFDDRQVAKELLALKSHR
ncbi:MAG TPA: UDP-N-acetylmuramoyl-L-alanyl-D-glutamate--2,6-diaminopimelate ligase [Opitutaceae bacterium]|nr:UDP-N-acetylmuramoyl-L-alanyl-D-glutamate--2,6-diaminopimelate ligase [Opitutaceae bacterium]